MMSKPLSEKEELKPRVAVSKCLGFEACRFNGEKLHDRFLEVLEPHAEYVFVCPEVEIGLGTPRDPIRLVSPSRDKAHLKLLQPATERDVTRDMQEFSRRFLSSLPEIDGWVLKSASPTCAIKDAKYYSGTEKAPAFSRGPGLFGQAVLEAFPHAAVEDEGRLTNLLLREHFLTRIFTFARFRALHSRASMGGLVRFHAVHKMMLLAYNQVQMRKLGRLVANRDRLALEPLLGRYREGLALALARAPRFTSHLNVLMHCFGYVSERLEKTEKAFFLDLLQKYRQQQIPIVSITKVLESWLIRFDTRYLLDQVYFRPFPEELVTLRDSGKGRLRG